MKLRRPNLEAIYREVDHYIPKKENLQPPRIGISANRKDGLSCIAETYVQAVLKAGGAPVLIPVITDIEALTAIVNGLDGLVMSGGGEMCIRDRWWRYQPALHAGRTNSRLAGCRYLPG